MDAKFLIVLVVYEIFNCIRLSDGPLLNFAQYLTFLANVTNKFDLQYLVVISF